MLQMMMRYLQNLKSIKNIYLQFLTFGGLGDHFFGRFKYEKMNDLINLSETVVKIELSNFSEETKIRFKGFLAYCWRALAYNMTSTGDYQVLNPWNLDMLEKELCEAEKSCNFNENDQNFFRALCTFDADTGTVVLL